jgi:hypothetical protein
VYAARHLDGQYDDHYGPRGTWAYAEALTPAIEECLDAQGGAGEEAASQSEGSKQASYAP